jgi:hypothetical protein
MEFPSKIQQNNININLNQNEFNSLIALTELKKITPNDLIINLIRTELKKSIDNFEKNYTYISSEKSLAKDWLTEENRIWDTL